MNEQLKNNKKKILNDLLFSIDTNDILLMNTSLGKLKNQVDTLTDEIKILQKEKEDLEKIYINGITKINITETITFFAEYFDIIDELKYEREPLSNNYKYTIDINNRNELNIQKLNETYSILNLKISILPSINYMLNIKYNHLVKNATGTVISKIKR
jgi:hypothetical protein